MAVKVGIIGCGYWGPNMVRNFHETEGSSVINICDLRQERLDFIKKRYPFLQITTDYKDIISDPSIDAISICTPVGTHYKLAKEALENNKHVLIEKTMTQDSGEARELIAIAKKRKRILMVDHTFLYTGAVRKIKEIIERGELGDIYYFDSVRVNLGLFQHDINVLWDLAPHDISIMDYVLGKQPKGVSAIGSGHIKDGLENIAYLTMMFEGKLIAHIHANWLAPVKVRRTLIGGSKKMIVYDDDEPIDKVKVYDKGIEQLVGSELVYKALVSYRTGDMYAPKLDETEALRVECEHFLECINNSTLSITGGESGLRVVEILEAAEKSMRNNGKMEFLTRKENSNALGKI